MLKRLIYYTYLTLEIVKANILTAMEYRVSFLMKVVGMIINDFSWFGLWFIYFQRFPNVNGWEFRDMSVLYAIGAVNFGLVFVFVGGVAGLARKIAQGELDYFLSFPKNVVWHISVSYTDISAIGDTIFGLIILFVFVHPSLYQLLVYFYIIFVTAFIFFNFLLITQSVSFFVGNFEDAADQWLWSLLGFTLYPQSSYYGVLRIITMTLLPAFFIATLPNYLFDHFDLGYALILLLFAIATFLLGITLFYRGLKKYESGNLIQVKM